MYWIYSNIFWCRREVVKALFQEDEPRKTLDIEFPLPDHPWVYISAIWNDESEDDVTDIITEKVTPNEVLTPTRLLEMSGLVETHETGLDSVTQSRRIVKWEYMNSQTFEVCEITSDGLVNAVKPKTD
jgi:hypothetical protein